MKKTFIVPEVPGSKRQSHRDYTHAVIGQFDYDADLRARDKIYDVDISNFNYYQRFSSMKAGDTELVTGCYKPWTRTIGQDEINSCKSELEKSGCKTAEEYAEKCRLQRVKWVLEEKEKKDGKWVVLQWSQSYNNAYKGMSQFKWYKNVKVVETVEIIKTKKLA